MQFIISDLFIGIVLAAVMYGVNAWSITMEDGVRQNKGILLKNKFVKRILGLPDVAKRIDRLVLALDAGWVLYVLYGLLYYHTEIFPIKISYLKIGFIFLWVELATICYIGICIQKETVHHAKHREYFDFIEKEEWMEVDQVRYRCIYTRSKKKEPLKGVIVFYPSSYSLLQSSDGYYYVLAHEAGKDVMKQMANVGAYEELSDCFVRSGYATMCMELERGENIREKAGSLKIEDLADQIEAFAQKHFPDTEIILFLHGPCNRLLDTLCHNMSVGKVISMCGAAMSCESQLEQLNLWTHNKKRNHFEEIIKYNNSMVFQEDMKGKTLEEYIKEIKTISKNIPIFIGSVEQDPYTSAENVKKIEMDNLEYVSCHYFENTDFTLRTCCVNRKVPYDGRPVQEILTGNAELNATIPETILDWLESKCV